MLIAGVSSTLIRSRMRFMSFDYVIDTGDIQNQKLFARFTETDGMPDGLTMDADCGLWTALWAEAEMLGCVRTARLSAGLVYQLPRHRASRLLVRTIGISR